MKLGNPDSHESPDFVLKTHGFSGVDVPTNPRMNTYRISRNPSVEDVAIFITTVTTTEILQKVLRSGASQAAFIPRLLTYTDHRQIASDNSEIIVG